MIKIAIRGCATFTYDADADDDDEIDDDDYEVDELHLHCKEINISVGKIVYNTFADFKKEKGGILNHAK